MCSLISSQWLWICLFHRLSLDPSSTALPDSTPLSRNSRWLASLYCDDNDDDGYGGDDGDDDGCGGDNGDDGCGGDDGDDDAGGCDANATENSASPLILLCLNSAARWPRLRI